mgnify:FL=1
MDFSKKQAGQLRGTIKKQATKLEKFAFEISKNGSEQGTTVSLDIVVDQDDLTEKERKFFADSKGKAFNDEWFEVLAIKDRKEAEADLKTFGYDLTKIGVGASTQQPPAKETPQEGPQESEEELGSEF